MKLIFDRGKLGRAVYNDRNLVQCRCGKHWYPSKKMFLEFLKQYKDIPATAEVWSHQDLDTGKVTIHVELSYFISDAKEVESNG